VKVLYTMDDQNKTNCLARWPHILQVRTVVMDEGASIGVIELKTCIQAIVQCSPELVAKLGHDYTVYAYDYSEYDCPMVGQGMLSWALAAVSPTPNAPASQSQQLITGRVCKNIQGLFSNNGVAETLEVKLRLVPVPTILQSEYLANMERYRELSRGIPTGSNQNEWQSFIQSNPSLVQMANNINAPITTVSNQRDGISLEVVNQLLSPQLQPQESIGSFNMQNTDSRGPSPAGGRKPAQQNSRPSSRASVKRPRKPRGKKSAANGGNTSGYEEGTDGDEGPAPKKRAKITQTDWNSKSGFGTVSDSLRVAASTAGSLRAFRPIAAMQPNSGSNAGNYLQEVPRAPTPVPGASSQAFGIDRGRSQSTLRRDSIASQSFDSRLQQYQSPYHQTECEAESHDQIHPSIESAMTSPEKYGSPSDTPPDIGSSPPVLRTATSLRSSPQIPSSPVLPQMPRTDSGFMSGDVSELFEEDDEMRPIDDDDIAIAAQYSRRTAKPALTNPIWEEVNPGPPENLPRKLLPRTEPRAKADPKVILKPKVTRPRASRARAGSAMSDDSRIRPASKAGDEANSQQAPFLDLPSLMHFPPSAENMQHPSMTQPAHTFTAAPASASSNIRPAHRPMSRTASAGSLTLPTITASDPVLPPTGLHRSHTWSEAPFPATDAACPATDAPTAGQIARGETAGTKAKKNAQKSRLELAIERGEMPPFCSNCGAIETPTWRKGFAQDHKGDPGYHEYSDAPGKVTAIEILERNDEGRPVSYRIFKKSLSPNEAKSSFLEILLCNPCGIWMAKYKTMRPESKWAINQDVSKQPSGVDKKPRQRSTKPKKIQAAQASHLVEPTSEACFQSDVFGTVDYGPSQEVSQLFQPQAATAPAQEQLRVVQKQRASSVQPSKRFGGLTSDAASAALRRAIQSSPARWVGSQHSPIELEEEDMGSTRRLLFPSPRKDSGFGVLCEIATNFPTMGAGNADRRKDIAVSSANKENCPPAPLFDDVDGDIAKLFDEEISRSRPSTPVQKSPPTNPFKTPTRPTPSHRPITRSVSKSAKSIRMQMLPQRTPTRSSATRRRSPRNHQDVFESPFTATLKKLMSETDNNDDENLARESPSHNLDFGLDFSNLPDLGHSGSNQMHSDALNFDLPAYDGNHDFFSTDFPMPSSPPRLFDVFEDPMTRDMNNMDNMDHMWSDFPIDDHSLQAMGAAGLVVDANGNASFGSAVNDDAKVKVESMPPPNEKEPQQSSHE
jgi:hypothetical protein